jgi:hypothetical protein
MGAFQVHGDFPQASGIVVGVEAAVGLESVAAGVDLAVGTPDIAHRGESPSCS